MLYAFGFDSVGIVAGDLYFFDPEANHGAEQGVRVELRELERLSDGASTFAAAPISIGRPIWRVDLLESVDNPGTLDRAHHHPTFDGWEPCDREFEDEMESDPVSWVCDRLSDLKFATIPTEEQVRIRGSVPEVRAAIDRLLTGVRSGSLAQPEAGTGLEPARVGWL